MPKSPKDLQLSLEEGEGLLDGGDVTREISRRSRRMPISANNWMLWMVHGVLITIYLTLIILQWRKEMAFEPATASPIPDVPGMILNNYSM
jgi:hypothetical protein